MFDVSRPKWSYCHGKNCHSHDNKKASIKVSFFWWINSKHSASWVGLIVEYNKFVDMQSSQWKTWSTWSFLILIYKYLSIYYEHNNHTPCFVSFISFRNLNASLEFNIAATGMSLNLVPFSVVAVLGMLSAIIPIPSESWRYIKLYLLYNLLQSCYMRRFLVSFCFFW